jgi:cellulose synthase A
VPGDEEEDGVDDLENEFNWSDKHDSQYVAESMLHAHMSYGRGADLDGVPQPFQPIPNVPLLTNGQMVPQNPPTPLAIALLPLLLHGLQVLN